MKHIFILFAITFFFCSCNKTSNNPKSTDSTQNNNPVIMALKAHVWLFDSIDRVQNGIVTSSLIEGEPKLQMWFTNDKLYFNTPGGPQNDEFNYEVKDTNKLYRWRNGNPENEYFIIQQLKDSLLVLSTHDTVYQDYSYYSPKP